MKLVIVESPTKARTLGRFLSSEYSVAASMGHLIDLPKSKLGVDVDNDFEYEKLKKNFGETDMLKPFNLDIL